MTLQPRPLDKSLPSLNFFFGIKRKKAKAQQIWSNQQIRSIILENSVVPPAHAQRLYHNINHTINHTSPRPHASHHLGMVPTYLWYNIFVFHLFCHVNRRELGRISRSDSTQRQGRGGGNVGGAKGEETCHVSFIVAVRRRGGDQQQTASRASITSRIIIFDGVNT